MTQDPKPRAWLLEGTQAVEFDRQPYHSGAEWSALYDQDTIDALRAEAANVTAELEAMCANFEAMREEKNALRAEVERLRGCLAQANSQAEHFEREWYLRGDEVERLRKDAERYRRLRDTPWPREVERAVMLHANASWDAAIDAAMKEPK